MTRPGIMKAEAKLVATDICFGREEVDDFAKVKVAWLSTTHVRIGGARDDGRQVKGSTIVRGFLSLLLRGQKLGANLRYYRRRQ